MTYFRSCQKKTGCDLAGICVVEGSLIRNQVQSHDAKFCKNSSMLKLTDGFCMLPPRYRFQCVWNTRPNHEVKLFWHLLSLILTAPSHTLLLLVRWHLDCEFFYMATLMHQQLTLKMFILTFPLVQTTLV